jgi:hypothetical protein
VVALLRALAQLGEHRLLVRLIKGRAWIVIVAFALIGIVTLQLGLLELNTNIGRTLERAGTLQRENAALSVENSEMASGELVEDAAGKLGMTLVPVGALRFLASHPRSDIARAASALDNAAHTRAEAAAAAQARAAEAAAAAASPSTSESESSPGGESSGGSSSEAGAGESASASTEPGSGEATSASGPTG